MQKVATDEVIDVVGLQFVLIDGFANTHTRGGVTRLIAYRLSHTGEKVPVLGLDCTEEACSQLRMQMAASLIPIDRSQVELAH